MIVLITGGRDFKGYDLFHDGMVESGLLGDIDLIIQGGATGADAIARAWACNNNTHCATIPALWDVNGKAAGPIRNSIMLKLNPDVCIAFPGGRGTDDMVKKCAKAGIKVIKPLEER